MPIQMDAEAIHAFLTEHFPVSLRFGAKITAVEEDALEVTLPFKDRFLRPGGTISGPAMMTLADTAMFYLVLSQVGPSQVAVTSSLSINFLRRPEPADLIARAEMQKLGRTLAVGTVTMRSEGQDKPVAHATVTYALNS